MTPDVLTDVRYAIRQLRRFGDVLRALDALERVEEALAGGPDTLPFAEAAARDENRPTGR